MNITIFNDREYSNVIPAYIKRGRVVKDQKMEIRNRVKAHYTGKENIEQQG